jgi:hypothetical protein
MDVTAMIMVKAAMTDIMAPAIRSIPLRLVQGFFNFSMAMPE